MPNDKNKFLEDLAAAEELIRSAARKIEDDSAGLNFIEALQLATQLSSLLEETGSIGVKVCEQLSDGRILKNTEDQFDQVGGSPAESSLKSMSAWYGAGGHELCAAAGSFKRATSGATTVLIRKLA